MTSLVRCCVGSFIIFTYWCSTVSAQVVDIPDPALERAIRQELNLPDEMPITQQEMLRLTRLDAGENQIEDLSGLEHATNLTWLALHGNEIQDLSPLDELLNIETLYLWSNPISDLSPIANLIQLRSLDLGGCQISDIAPLTNLTQLESLRLHYNQISDISSLTKLTWLTGLWLQSNQISDITPLAGLKQLTELALSHNRIVDVSPLANLANLVDLKIAGNLIGDFSPLLELNLENVDMDIHMLQELASAEVEITDPNLNRAIREQLALTDETALTQLAMKQLTGLDAGDSQIEDLAGLEHATNVTRINLHRNSIGNLEPLAELIQLEYLSLWGNPISDLSPLANLIQLKSLDLGACQISDIAPLASLMQLEWLHLHHNQISNITPLANLKQLTDLWLTSNRIVDVSPLANLTMLEELRIEGNFIKNLDLLEGLSLTRFTYDEICELPRLPIRERIQNRSFPSVFKAWDNILNRPTLSHEDQVAHHDLFWSPSFGLHWLQTNQGIQLIGNLDKALQERDMLLDRNSNMLFLFEIRMRDAFITNFYHEDWTYWIRDTTGDRVPAASDYSAFLVDFTRPGMQDLIVQQAIAVAKCGLYDGIFLDWWKEGHAVLRVDWSEEGYPGNETEQRARDVIIQRIRAGVGDDFLILVNPNRNQPRRAGPYINGLFMETLRDYNGGYTHDGLIEIESTLLWAEENLREPLINSLEGWGVETEAPDSPTNRRWMRVFTTMGLTHSDGYVLYITGIRSPNHEHDWNTFEPTHAEVHDRGIIHNHHHDHYWYGFWDADLGKSIGPKAQQYQNAEGLFIREFTNGWAVYNRSGTAQEISLVENAMGVASGQAGTTHRLADLDGEIYLKSSRFADVNNDGHVNVLDLIQVINSLGKSAPDPNGDGVVNILDLVFVASHLSQ